MNEVCVNHDDTQAVEHCEVCGDALCPRCLWYDAGGRRLCHDHALAQKAAGGAVLSPETYQEAIPHSLRRAAGTPAGERGLYRGNQNDLAALLAAVFGLVTLFSCLGGLYCLPVLAVILGLAMYLSADQSLEPRRTRLLAGIGLGTGAFFVVVIAGFILFYIGFIVLAITMGP